MKKLFILLGMGAIVVSLLVFSGYSAFSAIPHLINYQGMLTQSDGKTPVTNGNYDLTFKIYGSSGGVDSLWTEHRLGVTVTNGLFNVILGDVTTLNLAFNTDYWLGIKVGTDPELSPRIRLTSVGYAFQAQWSDTANYARSGGGGSGSPWIFRITDGNDSTITTGGRWGIARYGNVLYGNGDSTHVNLGVACTTGTNGQNYKRCTVGGGMSNTASNYNATVGGGVRNTASGNSAIIGGGNLNTASGDFSTTGGGYQNIAFGFSATVGGGEFNTASGGDGVVGGGFKNRVDGDYSAILGGYADTITSAGDYSYLFGIKSKLTQDSTFMVDMPHIRFGKESGGYEFPTSDGASGRVLGTNGSGQLSWMDASTSAGGWTDDGSVVRLTTSTDKVGIGTSNPDTYSKLHIVVPRTQTFDRVTIECPRDSNGFGIELKQPGGYWRLGQNVGNGWNDYFTITNNISPYYRLTILSDGKVGIGTVDAAYKLDVRGDRIQLKEDATGDSIAMRTDGTAVDLSFGGANLYVQSSTAGEHILLNPTTNSYVGIGTTSPGTKLDVASSSGTAIRTVTTSASGSALEAKAKEAGGYFLDTDDSAYARCGYGGYGVQAQGNSAGGCFKDKNGSGEAWVGTDHQGGWESGIDAYGNAWGGGFTDKDDGGWAWVAYGSYKIWGSGSADFVQNHPNDKNRVIVYAAPEGDEVATYTRGTARLINGEARVILGETFKWVTNPDIGLTAHITPRGECEGLFVASLTTSEMVVKELRGGTSNVEFDYLIYGLRIGFEEASVVQEKIKEAYIPSMKNHRELYNKYPKLRQYNAMERFKQMNAEIGKPVPNMNDSRLLRDAIHEFDPAIDKLPEPEKP